MKTLREEIVLIQEEMRAIGNLHSLASHPEADGGPDWQRIESVKAEIYEKWSMALKSVLDRTQGEGNK